MRKEKANPPATSSQDRGSPRVRTEQNYFQALRALGIAPNFWLSVEYIFRKGLEVVTDGDRWGLAEDGDWFFPPLRISRYGFSLDLDATYFCGFPGVRGIYNRPLDVQYIYNPREFLNLEGGKWKVFRKNVRKFANRFPRVQYRQIGVNEYGKDSEALLFQWSEGKTLEDVDVLVDFALKGFNRWGLFVDDELVGLNVADENWMYINYRLCIDNGSPFLQELLRYQFYTSKWTLLRRKQVNDGGNLGLPGLQRFKEKLNPLAVEQIYTTMERDSNDGN